MSVRWAGTGVLRPGVLELHGPMGSLPHHAHHSVQVAVADAGSFVIEDGEGREQRARAAIVPPDVAHAFRARDATGLVAHVDPESALGRELTELVEQPDSVAAWCSAGTTLTNSKRLWNGIGLQTSPEAEPTERHPAIDAAIVAITARVALGPIRLRDVAADVHISESRLAHLFTRDLGLPFRAYIRWARLQRAVAVVAEGASLTEAAHAAGFVDSSHLTRVCRRAFGAPPSDFGEIRWQVVT